jgi:hypothetical protein
MGFVSTKLYSWWQRDVDRARVVLDLYLFHRVSTRATSTTRDEHKRRMFLVGSSELRRLR